jgi:hypothetical protein
MSGTAGSGAAAHRTSGPWATRGVQRFFLYLTPRRALLLFSTGLGAGILLILAGRAPLWAPIVPVILYGGGLLYAQGRFLVRLDGTLKDSPYFLGFLLTLFALFDTFNQLAGMSSGALPVGLVVGKAGAAILPTVAGLFLRQVLLSLDGAEEAREAVFQSMAQEIRDRTVEFHRMHAGFVDLVRDFTSAREQMFVREEVAFARYVERMEAGASLLGTMNETYPPRVEAMLGSLRKLATELDRAGTEAARQVESWDEAWRQRVRTLQDAHLAAADGARESLTGTATELRREMEALVALVRESVPTVASHVRAADLALGAYAGSAERLSAVLADVEGHAARAGEGLGGVAEDARAAGAALRQGASSISVEAENLHRERLDAARRDLAAIDGLIDELAEVLRRRIAAGSTP